MNKSELKRLNESLKIQKVAMICHDAEFEKIISDGTNVYGAKWVNFLVKVEKRTKKKSGANTHNMYKCTAYGENAEFVMELKQGDRVAFYGEHDTFAGEKYFGQEIEIVSIMPA